MNSVGFSWLDGAALGLMEFGEGFGRLVGLNVGDMNVGLWLSDGMILGDSDDNAADGFNVSILDGA